MQSDGGESRVMVAKCWLGPSKGLIIAVNRGLWMGSAQPGSTARSQPFLPVRLFGACIGKADECRYWPRIENVSENEWASFQISFVQLHG